MSANNSRDCLGLPRWGRRTAGVAAVLAAVLLAGAAGVNAQTIPPGNDCFETPVGSTSVVFGGGGGGGGALPPIPADFFGPGSDPFDGIIALRGEGGGGMYGGNVSTVVARLDTAVMPGPATVAVQLIELNLVSTDPIHVTYDGGAIDSFFDVVVTPSTLLPSNGSMKIWETAPGIGGLYSFTSLSGGGIYLHPVFTFTRTEPPFDEFVLADTGYDVLLETDEISPPEWQYAEPTLHCEPDNLFYPVPDVLVPVLLNGGDAGEHGVIPPRFPDGCCLADGTCIDIDPLDCQALGGTPQGQPCTGLIDACCLPDGTCAMVDPLCCDDLQGVLVPGGLCNTWTEACCDSFPPDGCMNSDPMCCVQAWGGTLPGVAACMGDMNSNGVDEACEQQPQDCQPLPDGSACEPFLCPDTGDQCLPRCVEYDPQTGGTSIVTDCECRDPFECHVDLPGSGGPDPGNPCIEPDVGGTVDLPPAGCAYLSPQEVHMIIDGLPPGSTLELDPIHAFFFNTVRTAGGTLGGEIEVFDSQLQLHITGTGEYEGYERTMSLDLACEVHTGPRNPGDPVQDFENDMYRLQGGLSGDPDFDSLVFTGGTDFGLPGPGHTTLTELPSGDFAVDSFFDITYQITFTGAAGSQFQSLSGTTTGTLRMETGFSRPTCIGGCSNGLQCEETVTVDINGIETICCDCVPIPAELEPKWIQRPHGPDQGFDEESDLWWNEGPPIKWEQRPDHTLTGHHCHDGPNVGEAIICANDWDCEGGQVTDFHWWGYHEPLGLGEQQLGFQISIHANGLGCLPADPALQVWTVPLSQITITDTGYVSVHGTPIYHYSWILPLPFAQQTGSRYWMDLSSISVDPNNEYIWKWSQSLPAPVNCPAAYKQLPTPGLWTSFDDVELAFVVTSDLAPQEVNKVVADDFISDGRPIEALRWWGSYFDEQYAPDNMPQPPYMIDGWFISFHWGDPQILNPGCPPDITIGDPHPTALAVYFAPASAVQIVSIGYPDCNGHMVYEYVVDLDQCCLLCTHPDPRTGFEPAADGAFNEEAELHYWLDFQAVVGVTWDPPACTYDDRILTGNLPSPLSADGHFWGWHTSPAQTMKNGPLWSACTGRIVDFAPYPFDCWDYGDWDSLNWKCPTIPPPQIDMAFELLAPPWPVVRSVVSCRYHCSPHPGCDDATTEYCLAIGLGTQAYRDSGLLGDYNIEPRLGGATKLKFDMSQAMDPLTVTGANVLVSCYNNVYAGVITASLDGTSTVVAGFNPGLPNKDCCRIDFPGMASLAGYPVTDAYFVGNLEADANRDYAVSTADYSSVKARLGQVVTVANQQYEVNTDGAIGTADASSVKGRLGSIAPQCP